MTVFRPLSFQTAGTGVFPRLYSGPETIPSATGRTHPGMFAEEGDVFVKAPVPNGVCFVGSGEKKGGGKWEKSLQGGDACMSGKTAAPYPDVQALLDRVLPHAQKYPKEVSRHVVSQLPWVLEQKPDWSRAKQILELILDDEKKERFLEQWIRENQGVASEEEMEKAREILRDLLQDGEENNRRQQSCYVGDVLKEILSKDRFEGTIEGSAGENIHYMSTRILEELSRIFDVVGRLQLSEESAVGILTDIVPRVEELCLHKKAYGLKHKIMFLIMKEILKLGHEDVVLRVYPFLKENVLPSLLRRGKYQSELYFVCDEEQVLNQIGLAFDRLACYPERLLEFLKAISSLFKIKGVQKCIGAKIEGLGHAGIARALIFSEHDFSYFAFKSLQKMNCPEKFELLIDVADYLCENRFSGHGYSQKRGALPPPYYYKNPDYDYMIIVIGELMKQKHDVSVKKVLLKILEAVSAAETNTNPGGREGVIVAVSHALLDIEDGRGILIERYSGATDINTKLTILEALSKG